MSGRSAINMGLKVVSDRRPPPLVYYAPPLHQFVGEGRSCTVCGQPVTRLAETCPAVRGEC